MSKKKENKFDRPLEETRIPSPVGLEDKDSTISIFMNALLLEEASKVIPQPQVLINMVSHRVKQLMAGSRPMVEDAFRLGLADIAFMEIAQGKLVVATKPEVPEA